MAAYKEAISLLRVHSSYYSMGIPYLNLSILFLNSINTIACSQSVDNLFNTIDGPPEKRILSNIQSTLFLHQRVLMPSIVNIINLADIKERDF